MDLIYLSTCFFMCCIGYLLQDSFVKCDIQLFRTAPTNTQVVEGQVAILRCHVLNQVGTVQWVKDGELLGFDPQIPGYPRYRIIGNSSLGIYNLKIVNAQIEDDAEYECQVGPGEGHDPIIGKARVTVLLQPTSIQIVNRANGSEVQVEVSKSISLECEVKGGKPAPEVVWYRNSYRLSSEQSKKSISEDGVRQTVKSVLEITPNPDDDKAHYVCEAYTAFSSSRLKAFVILDVLYPPGKPVIEGFRLHEKIRAGESVKIKCVSRGGNPLARLIWSKNGRFFDHSYTTSDWEAVNEYSFTAEASDDGATYTCSASSSMTPEPLEKSVVLEVLYAPSSVSIKVPKEAKPGDIIAATCKTEPSNPASEVTWVIDGRPMTSDNEVKADSKGGWVTKSKINVNVTQQDRNSKMFTCYAVNQELGETVTKSASVSILYAPDPPAIFGYVEGTAIHAGKLQRLTCISHGGNPLPELKWFKGDQELAGSQASITGTIISKELAIIAAADDNGAQYYCKSASKAISQPLVSTITLTVYFPPVLPTITVEPKKPTAGSQVYLICECRSSNPAANITWWTSGEKDEMLDPPNNTVNSAGENQGYSSKATLSINVTAADDGAKYKCQATNEAIQQSSHDAIVLSVFYKPVFKISDNSVFEIKENDSSVINIEAKGNPGDITYKWMKNNVTVWEGSLFNITSAQRSQSGTYMCLAKNEIGESSITVIVKVLYPMVIMKSSGDQKKIIAEPSSNVKLDCRADGYPLPKDAITWKYDSSNMQEQPETIAGFNGKSTLIVKNVTKEMSGTYTCEANNGIGSPDTWAIIILVKHEPLIKDLDSYKNVFSDRRTSVELQCKAEGVPEVLFSWLMEGVVISQGNSRISNTVTQLDHFMWKSVLTIADVNLKDFGEYKCVARNEMGFDTAEINLLPDSAPDPPLLVNVANITKNSLLVVWVPGFSGGHNQTHRIRFKSLMDPAASYVDVHPPATNSVWVRNLLPDTQYELAMMSSNQKGSSPYTTDRIKVKTLGSSQEGFKVRTGEDFSFSGSLVELLVGTIGTVFLLLLIFNIILMALYYRKKRPKLRRKYAEDEMSSSSDVSTSSKVESEETTFSSFASEPKEYEDRISSYSFESSYTEYKTASYEPSSMTRSNEYSDEYSSKIFKGAYPSTSNFI